MLISYDWEKAYIKLGCFAPLRIYRILSQFLNLNSFFLKKTFDILSISVMIRINKNMRCHSKVAQT